MPQTPGCVLLPMKAVSCFFFSFVCVLACIYAHAGLFIHVLHSVLLVTCEWVSYTLLPQTGCSLSRPSWSSPWSSPPSPSWFSSVSCSPCPEGDSSTSQASVRPLQVFEVLFHKPHKMLVKIKTWQHFMFSVFQGLLNLFNSYDDNVKLQWVEMEQKW